MTTIILSLIIAALLVYIAVVRRDRNQWRETVRYWETKYAGEQGLKAGRSKKRLVAEGDALPEDLHKP